MSSIEFWEGEPQLYWAYRFSYLKKIEAESRENKFCTWLNGKCTEIAVSVALNNGFNKKKVKYPTYDEMFAKNEDLNEAQQEIKKQTEGIEDIDVIGQIEFNYWARN